MRIGERMLRILGGKTLDGMVAQRVQDAIDLRLREAAASTRDPDDYLYRRIGGSASNRDLTPLTQREMARYGHSIGQSNPLGKWVLDMGRDLVLAGGVRVEAAEDAVQEVLDTFWNDDINNMDITLQDKVRELALFGEQCWPVFVNEQTGLMRLAVVDPERIVAVAHDPDNAAQPIGITLQNAADQPGKKLRVLVGLTTDEELFAPAATNLRQNVFTDADAFWFTVNKTSTATRGVSDIFTVIDWLEALESLLFNILDRTGYLNAFCWDILLRGRTDEQIQAWLGQNPAPRPGSQFAHNENVEMKAVAPDLHSEDMERAARVFYNHILGAMGLPEHWYGGGTDVNRASATEMIFPTLVRHRQRQQYVRYILTRVLKRQLYEAEKRNPSLARVDQEFTIHMPRIDIRDVLKAAAALPQIVNAAAVAETRGWISAVQASRMFASASEELGVHLHVEGTEVQERSALPEEYRQQQTTRLRAIA